MKLHDPKFEKTLARREARARRSKRLGRFLFSVLIFAIMLTLRLNPEVSADIARYIDQSQQVEDLGDDLSSSMPKNRVKVRKGIEQRLTTSPDQTQAVARDIERQLSKFTVGQ